MKLTKPASQAAGSYGFQLVQARCRIKVQFRVGLLLAEAPEKIRNHSAPGRILGKSDAQRPRTTVSHASCARGRVVYLLEDTSRILQKQLARWIELHAAREAFEKLETDFFFQILYLAGKRRLCHAQSTRCAPKMLFLADRHEIAQVPQFHSDTLLPIGLIVKISWTY